ncbi:MAG: type IV secretory system conjugative DNA transfer family protein [Bacilli bacterium]|nr:type IV secretory system conjugative DNA transfer family protein [Bacilli bacterium]
MEKTNLIVGKIDSGKTKGILFKEVNALIKKEENILILDSKEEYYKQYSNTLKESGYNVVVLNLNDPLKSHAYNPYSLPYQYHKEGNMDTCIELVEKISRAIFFDDASNADPFWNNAAADLVTGIALIVMREAQEEEVNLGSISVGIDLVGKGTGSDNLITKYLESLDKTDPIYTVLSSIVFAANDTKLSILSVAKQRIKAFCLRPNLLSLLSNTSFEITDKTAIFVISKVNAREISSIANIMIDQVFYQVLERNMQFNFVLDNIDFISMLDSLNDALTIAYSNFKITLATRNLESLKYYYPKGLFDNVIRTIHVEDVQLAFIEEKQESIRYPEINTNSKFFKIEEYLENKQ